MTDQPYLPPRIAAAVEARRAGKSNREIARDFGCRLGTVSTYITEARKRGASIPDKRINPNAETRMASLLLLPAQANALKPYADKRGLTLPRLCHALIEEIARDPSLVDAILDDGRGGEE